MKRAAVASERARVAANSLLPHWGVRRALQQKCPLDGYGGRRELVLWFGFLALALGVDGIFPRDPEPRLAIPISWSRCACFLASLTARR